MDLLDYPIPELDTTLQEASRVLQLTLNPEQYQHYKNALLMQSDTLQEAQEHLKAKASGRENWVTEEFKKRLLSCHDPLPTSTAIPSVLPSSKIKGESAQTERATALLWAVAKLYSEPCLVEGDVPTERTQQSQVFAANRLPGKNQDELKIYTDSLHAILICGGGIFPIQILQQNRPGEPLSSLALDDIYTQLVHAMSHPAPGPEQDPPIICGLTSLNRQAWHAVRTEILKAGGEAAESLKMMETALLAVSLEDYPAPADLADILNAVRLEEKDRPCLRYYDKVVNLVVFKDGQAGMLFEHSALDGMVAGLLVERLWQLSESQNQKNYTQTNGSAPPSNTNFLHPTPLKIPLENITLPNQFLSNVPQASQSVMTFEIESYPDVFTTIRGHRGLYDAWINFTLQLSLRQTLGEAATSHIMVTPTHMRHFKHGRCDPTYSTSVRSRQLVTALASCIGPDDNPRYTNKLFRLFHLAFVEHKNLIKATKVGLGVGPHLAALRRFMPQDSALKKFLDPFGCPSIYLTGSDLMEGVECAVGNVYATDQLAVTYLGRKDRVRLVLNGKGVFASVLGNLKEQLEFNLKLVILLALRYAIAGQMGAIECLLQENEERQADSIHKIKQDFSLVIHGGAGEEMMRNQKVTKFIEFALQTALTLGAQILTSGGSSLDAVQRSVTALEDCFLFNAGKGSVYNRDGEHEMEATIVDGHGKNSGSVACLRNVKNPIKAARCIMEKSMHSLLTGQGAEEFLDSLGDKDTALKPDYFDTDIRYKELFIRSGASKINHPQTVGAVALDRSGKLAAATSTGGLVGKWKGRVGDTAIVGAGVYADEKLAVTCSGDGDAFLRQTVAHKVASLYNLKGYSLRRACQEVIHDDLEKKCAGIIAVDHKGVAIIETNAGVMFVASMVDGIRRTEVLQPIKSFSNVIWETEELVAYLQSNPWTPGATVLTRKTLNGPSSIFQLALPDYISMLQGAQTVANLLREKLAVHRCALVVMPEPDKPVCIKVLPLHGLDPKWMPHLSEETEFNSYDPGYCSSKIGPRCEDTILDQVQAKIRSRLPTANAPSIFDFHGEPSDTGLFPRIIRGEEQQWRVWEDNDHVAFLTPFPNTPGFTVLVPRKPLTSDIFSLDEGDYTALIVAIRKVSHLVKEGINARGVALIFEGFEIDYAHAKLIPLVSQHNCLTPGDVAPQFCPTYPGYVTSLDGPTANKEELTEVHKKITKSTPPHSWENPHIHATTAIKSKWYRNLFQIQNTLFHSTVEYFHNKCKYSYALTPITTDTISSPMGLGSDSEPVFVNMLGQDVYLADSMQFVLEYFLRFQDGLPGAYYVSPSFRGEDPDATHLNQFYHVECELLGDMDASISIAEGYVAHLTQAMLKEHSNIILDAAGTLSHVHKLLKSLKEPLPKITLDQAIHLMPSSDCLDWVQEGQPHFGRKLTRKGEKVLIEKYGAAVWLTEMDHLGVPFYQAYVEGSGRSKAKAADLLFGLGETVGLGERHSTPEMVKEALQHHAVPEDSYKWYINMRQVIPLSTSGWGMGTERYLCWLLQHNDVRDMQIIPRLKAKKFMP
ncbi:putative isoaspartyl peptidase/L-asparaginase [Triplophysa tibetana]|uniref:Isoaspartyl peptidase/L-asparaginase n=1 Tax=Triplophysa tibetana TaxID=1572043 RepID=A0A5A9N8G9_9TELE|nr:putative isoaspartyl peptidase/L-asparaginase [Triplophysa tibetana]